METCRVHALVEGQVHGSDGIPILETNVSISIRILPVQPGVELFDVFAWFQEVVADPAGAGWTTPRRATVLPSQIVEGRRP
jgi:hypothetical protein